MMFFCYQKNIIYKTFSLTDILVQKQLTSADIYLVNFYQIPLKKPAHKNNPPTDIACFNNDR